MVIINYMYSYNRKYRLLGIFVSCSALINRQQMVAYIGNHNMNRDEVVNGSMFSLCRCIQV